MEQLVEAWQIHNRIHIYLLANIDENYLKDVSASKGRTVGEQFAHIHNVRMMWLKVADASLFEALNKIEKENITKEILVQELNASAGAIAQLLAKSDGKIKGFKPNVTAFLAYLISHESHHRGQIMLSLKQSGHPVDKKVQFGIWEWGTR
jgi:uncharacterized damage-inducible protein DinB